MVRKGGLTSPPFFSKRKARICKPCIRLSGSGILKSSTRRGELKGLAILSVEQAAALLAHDPAQAGEWARAALKQRPNDPRILLILGSATGAWAIRKPPIACSRHWPNLTQGPLTRITNWGHAGCPRQGGRSDRRAAPDNDAQSRSAGSLAPVGRTTFWRAKQPRPKTRLLNNSAPLCATPHSRRPRKRFRSDSSQKPKMICAPI